MSQILGLKFREAGQIYYFESGPFVVSPGDHVIVNTEQGFGLGKVVVLRDDMPEFSEDDEVKSIYRLATDEDIEKNEENLSLARDSFAFCRKCIRERSLDMKLVDVEVFFDRSKIIFYFTAPNRIDFRELVKDLVRTYRTRIELRQIGVRHETQMIGAVGNCGQVCCCRRFLRKFAPVTIKMAKEQNLFLNPTKISGICGRLLCCLSYEQSNYEEFHRLCPKVGKKYQTNDGLMKVVRANLFRSSLTVITDDGEEKEICVEEWAELAPRRPDPNLLQQQGSQPPSESSRGRRPLPPLHSNDGGAKADRRGDRDRKRPDKGSGDSPEMENNEAQGAQAPQNSESEAPSASENAFQDRGGRRSGDKGDRDGGRRGRPQKHRPRKSTPREDGGEPREAKSGQQPGDDSKTGKPRRKRKRKPKPKSS